MIQEMFYNFTAGKNKLCPMGFGGLAPNEMFYNFTAGNNKLCPASFRTSCRNKIVSHKRETGKSYTQWDCTH